MTWWFDGVRLWRRKQTWCVSTMMAWWFNVRWWLVWLGAFVKENITHWWRKKTRCLSCRVKRVERAVCCLSLCIERVGVAKLLGRVRYCVAVAFMSNLPLMHENGSFVTCPCFIQCHASSSLWNTWLRQLLQELKFGDTLGIKLMRLSKVIHIAPNAAFHDWTKHKDWLSSCERESALMRNHYWLC